VIDGTFTAPSNRLQFHPFELDDEAAHGAGQGPPTSINPDGQTWPHYRDTAEDMRWRHGGGFSVNAAVQINKEDRPGFERLLRYCARPVFASEKMTTLRQDKQLGYALPKPTLGGRFGEGLAPKPKPLNGR